ncbi:hypothetical protein [Cellulomonas dongxiuzhuiae]|uniref:hypothetical protein n=1 Tax=Cellulomonas dongxiuzhuiae TaxID=2819979 RepID=UPI001AB006ED|nr:hypothetical protein [Cellulomonas dongxiuzhuiae]MBO3089146.1 hypothetical protein [Cellulomonas dongxiuzhuiae]
MDTVHAWTREQLPLAARVGASAVLGVAVGATGVLRAADDLPMGIALLTMGTAALVHAAMSLGGGRDRRHHRVVA